MKYLSCQLLDQQKRVLALFLLAIVSLCCSCSASRAVKPNDPYYAPIQAPAPVQDAMSNGSLYQVNSGMNLFSDNKASRVGDIITVVLSETTQSRKSTNVEVTKEAELDNPAATLMGATATLNGMTTASNFTSDRDFKGEADADQSNSLNGTIAVTVVNVWPNGTLVIRGEKWMTLNRGDEYIRISGLVRPDDVSPSNTVMSSKIANARISYAGTGDLAQSQQMGALSRFFNSQYWPF